MYVCACVYHVFIHMHALGGTYTHVGMPTCTDTQVPTNTHPQTHRLAHIHQDWAKTWL